LASYKTNPAGTESRKAQTKLLSMSSPSMGSKNPVRQAHHSGVVARSSTTASEFQELLRFQVSLRFFFWNPFSSFFSFFLESLFMLITNPDSVSTKKKKSRADAKSIR
jgi:hypothetical protein